MGRTVCTETIEEIPNEVCSYDYQKKEEATTAKTVEVTFKKESKVQMVTVCAPTYGGYGHGGYGHNYCNEVAQTTEYNVPVVTPVDVDVTVAYPEPVKTCLGRVSSTFWQAGAANWVMHFSTDSVESSTSGTVMHLFSTLSSQLTRGRRMGLLTQVLTGSG